MQSWRTKPCYPRIFVELCTLSIIRIILPPSLPFHRDHWYSTPLATSSVWANILLRSIQCFTYLHHLRCRATGGILTPRTYWRINYKCWLHTLHRLRCTSLEVGFSTRLQCEKYPLVSGIRDRCAAGVYAEYCCSTDPLSNVLVEQAWFNTLSSTLIYQRFPRWGHLHNWERHNYNITVRSSPYLINCFIERLYIQMTYHY